MTQLGKGANGRAVAKHPKVDRTDQNKKKAQPTLSTVLSVRDPRLEMRV